MPVPGAPGLPQEGLTGSGCGGSGVVEAAAGEEVGLQRHITFLRAISFPMTVMLIKPCLKPYLEGEGAAGSADSGSSQPSAAVVGVP